MKPTEPPASSAQSTDAWDRAAASNELDAPLRLKNDADVVAAVPYLLGFQPRESTEAHRAETEARVPAADPRAPAVEHLGGWFIDLGHPDDEAAK